MGREVELVGDFLLIVDVGQGAGRGDQRGGRRGVVLVMRDTHLDVKRHEERLGWGEGSNSLLEVHNNDARGKEQ